MPNSPYTTALAKVAELRATRGWDGCGLRLELDADGNEITPTEPVTPATPAKVEFTPEQQAAVDALIGKRVAEETRKAVATAEQAATEKYTELETNFNGFKDTAASRLADMYARSAAAAAGVTDAQALDAVLTLAKDSIAAAIADGDVDAEKVTEAITTTVTNLPQLVTPKKADETPTPAAPGTNVGDPGNQHQEHIYTLAEVNKMGTKFLADPANAEILTKVESQFARGLIK